jgi:hypothetical protein
MELSSTVLACPKKPQKERSNKNVFADLQRERGRWWNLG